MYFTVTKYPYVKIVEKINVCQLKQTGRSNSNSNFNKNICFQVS